MVYNQGGPLQVPPPAGSYSQQGAAGYPVQPNPGYSQPQGQGYPVQPSGQGYPVQPQGQGYPVQPGHPSGYSTQYGGFNNPEGDKAAAPPSYQAATNDADPSKQPPPAEQRY